MRKGARIGLVSVLVAGIFGAGLAVVTPPVAADHTPDDVTCVVTHCVHAGDLASGDLTNYAEDGGFERIPTAQLGNPKSWPSRTGAPSWSVFTSNTECFGGNRCARRVGNGTAGSATFVNGSQPDAFSGEVFRASARVRSVGGANGQAGVQVVWVMESGALVSGPTALLNADSTGSWRTATVAATAPADVVRAHVLLLASNSAGTWYADAVEFRRLLTNGHLAPNSVIGTNIVDGSIGGSDLLPAIVNTSKLADGAVNSNKTLDSSLTGADVADGSLTLSDLLLAGANGLDSRYPTRTELTGGVPNTAGNPVSWGKLYNMPAAFADGTDNNAPKVFTARQNGSAVLCNDGCVVVSLALPSGTFLVTSKVTANQQVLSDQLYAVCTLGRAGQTSGRDGSEAVMGDTATLTNQFLHSGSATTMQLICRDDDIGDGITYNGFISAIQVTP